MDAKRPTHPARHQLCTSTVKYDTFAEKVSLCWNAWRILALQEENKGQEGCCHAAYQRQELLDAEPNSSCTAPGTFMKPFAVSRACPSLKMPADFPVLVVGCHEGFRCWILQNLIKLLTCAGSSGSNAGWFLTFLFSFLARCLILVFQRWMLLDLSSLLSCLCLCLLWFSFLRNSSSRCCERAGWKERAGCLGLCLLWESVNGLTVACDRPRGGAVPLLCCGLLLTPKECGQGRSWS